MRCSSRFSAEASYVSLRVVSFEAIRFLKADEYSGICCSPRWDKIGLRDLFGIYDAAHMSCMSAHLYT